MKKLIMFIMLGLFSVGISVHGRTVLYCNSGPEYEDQLKNKQSGVYYDYFTTPEGDHITCVRQSVKPAIIKKGKILIPNVGLVRTKRVYNGDFKTLDKGLQIPTQRQK